MCTYCTRGLTLIASFHRDPKLPFVVHRGFCFPISVYCRSPDEATRVWQILQPIAEVMDGEPNEAVAVAFLTNVVVAKMFQDDDAAEAYAAFFGMHRRPVLFLSWYVMIS